MQEKIPWRFTIMGKLEPSCLHVLNEKNLNVKMWRIFGKAKSLRSTRKRRHIQWVTIKFIEKTLKKCFSWNLYYHLLWKSLQSSNISFYLAYINSSTFICFNFYLISISTECFNLALIWDELAFRKRHWINGYLFEIVVVQCQSKNAIQCYAKDFHNRN